MAYYNEYHRYGDAVAAVEPGGIRASYRDLGEFSSRIREAVGGRTLVFAFCKNTIGFSIFC